MSIGAPVVARSWTVAPSYFNHHLSVRRRPSVCRAWQRDHPSVSSLAPTRPFYRPLTHLSYHAAASVSAKGRKFNPDENTHEHDVERQEALGLRRGATRARQKANRVASGQDALFVANLPADAIAFGVADGVGGWASSGIDSADFSHGFCHSMATTALEWGNERLSPRTLMEIGYRKVINDRTLAGGGSTACIGIAGRDGTLQMANLGDSGFLHLRLGAVHQCSDPQTHAFNTPYQLTVVPPRMLAQLAVFGGMPWIDLPHKADISTDQLQHGDVLVLATDGVWDNLNPQEVLKSVSSQMKSHGAWKTSSHQGLVVSEQITQLVRPGGLGEKPGIGSIQGMVAAAIAGEAKRASMNDKRDGPFAKEWQKHFSDEDYHGGKVDDICVIALVAVDPSAIGHSG